MAREIRSLKRSALSDEHLSTLPREVRWTFLGLILNADDYGRLRADPRLLKAAIYPLDDEVTADTLAAEIQLLEHDGFILLYEVEGTRYLEIGSFEKHQKMARKYGSDIPAPTEAMRAHAQECAQMRTHIRRGEEEGEEKERSGGSDVPTEAPAPVERTIVRAPLPALRPGAPPTELPASLLEMLPPEALELLTRFYELPAMTVPQRERYRAVAMQLVDALDPKHPGPKVRGGQRVKARSMAHMAAVCRDVMRNPPMDRDLAVLWVLKKLLDPEKGPTVTEVVARVESAARATEDRYNAAAKHAAVAWSKEHQTEYATLRAEVEAPYAGKRGDWIKAAIDIALTQRCAKEAGFPAFDQWRAASPDLAPR